MSADPGYRENVASHRIADSLRAAIHTIASQSPMTFPLAEFLVIKMRTYYHFDANPPMPVRAHFAPPTKPGYGIELDQAKVESRRVLTF